MSAGLIVAIITVLLLPPSAFINNRVNTESRNGTRKGDFKSNSNYSVDEYVQMKVCPNFFKKSITAQNLPRTFLPEDRSANA